jgi:hypothetical protein
MTKKKTEITIVRSKWRTGDSGENATGKGETRLVNKNGYKCCLGFIACEFRPHNKKIVDYCYPNECDFDIPDLKTLGGNDSSLTNSAVAINDDMDTTVKQKEVALKKLFKDSCYKLKFVD